MKPLPALPDSRVTVSTSCMPDTASIISSVTSTPFICGARARQGGTTTAQGSRQRTCCCSILRRASRDAAAPSVPLAVSLRGGEASASARALTQLSRNNAAAAALA